MSATPASSPVRRFALAAPIVVGVGVVVWGWFEFRGFHSSPPAAPANPSPDGGAAPPGIPSVAARMLESGVMRGLVANAQRKAIAQELDPIIAELKFTADQRDRFIDLLMANQGVVMEASLRRMTGPLSAAEDEELQRKVDAANTAARSQSEVFFAREFPGDPAKFQAFQRYTALAPDRVEVAALQLRLAGAHQALTPAQQTALAEVLHEVRAGVVPALDPEDPELAGLSAKDLAQRIRDQQRIDTLLRTKAATVLDPAQLSVLAAQQAERLQPFQVLVDQAPKIPASSK